MLRKSLILKLFDDFSIQRWNDKIRPVRLTQMDKNAHKMVIAYCLAKYEDVSATDPIARGLTTPRIISLERRNDDANA